MAIKLEPETFVDVCEVQHVLASSFHADPVTDLGRWEPGACEQRQHPPLQYRTRHALDLESPVQYLRHRTNPVATAHSKRPIPMFDFSPPNGAITLGAVERLLNDGGGCHRAEIDQGPRSRSHRNHTDQAAVGVGEGPRVMNQHTFAHVALTHWDQDLDNPRSKAVERMQGGRRTVRRQAFGSAVEHRRQNVLMPRMRCSCEAKHRRRDSLDNTSFDQASQLRPRQLGLVGLKAGEHAELAAGN
jgi:hypothetical protein